MVALGIRVALGGEARLVLTSRNALLPLRRTIATRWPDLIKSNGGSCQRDPGPAATRIVEHRTRRLCVWPERRWVHGCASAPRRRVGGEPARRRAAPRRAPRRRERRCAGPAALPVVLGGDFNIRGLRLDGFERAGGHEVDYVFVRGIPAGAAADVLDRGRLSDHAPVSVALSTVPIDPARCATRTRGASAAPSLPAFRAPAGLRAGSRRRTGRRSRAPSGAARGPSRSRRSRGRPRTGSSAAGRSSGARWVPSSLHGAATNCSLVSRSPGPLQARVGERRPQTRGVVLQQVEPLERLAGQRVLVVDPGMHRPVRTRPRPCPTTRPPSRR